MPHRFTCRHHCHPTILSLPQRHHSKAPCHAPIRLNHVEPTCPDRAPHIREHTNTAQAAPTQHEHHTVEQRPHTMSSEEKSLHDGTSRRNQRKASRTDTCTTRTHTRRHTHTHTLSQTDIHRRPRRAKDERMCATRQAQDEWPVTMSDLRSVHRVQWTRVASWQPLWLSCPRRAYVASLYRLYKKPVPNTCPSCTT